MTEVRIEAGAPYRISSWQVTSDRQIVGRVHWPTRISVGRSSIEVDCWTLVGRVTGSTDLDGSELDPDLRGSWRQLPTNRFCESGLPRVQAIRINSGKTNIGVDVDVDVDDVIGVDVEIGAGVLGHAKTLSLTLRELRALLAHADDDHNIIVSPPDCGAAVCQALLQIDPV